MMLVHEIAQALMTFTAPLPDNAKACHDAVECRLLGCGLNVKREYRVRNGDGINGRFDLVVFGDGESVAIEIDRRLVRAKSVQKLLGFDGGRIAIVRGKKPPHDIPGIDLTFGLPVEGVQ